YFYCSSNPQRDEPVDVLRSLLAQLAYSTDGSSVAEPVKKRVLERRNDPNFGQKLSLDDCVELLIGITQTNRSTTIIIDAIDECADDYELVETLRSICKVSRNVKLFLSNWMHVRVTQHFESPTGITITAQENCSDVESYIRREVTAPERRVSSGMTADLAERFICCVNYSRSRDVSISG